MRQLVAGGALLAFVAVSVQAPWSHVHEHHYDAHHDREHRSLKIHGHDWHHSMPGTLWRARSADEDARPVGQLTAVRDGASPPNLAIDRMGPVDPVEPVLEVVVDDLSPRSHGRPGLDRRSPRAPPA
jgi:hypothetical protein